MEIFEQGIFIFEDNCKPPLGHLERELQTVKGV